MFSESKEGEGDNHSDSSCLAGPALVSNVTGDVDTGSSKDTNLPTTSSVSPGRSSPTNPVRVLDPSFVENIGGPLSTAGLSKEAAELHEKAWRPGTRVSYKSSWGKWVSWCDEQSVDHVHTSVANIIEFLTKLHSDGLQYRTINTYRSAISKNHDLIEGVPVGKHPLVVRHMRAIFNQKPPLPKYEFSWDVDKVLSKILSWGDNDKMNIKQLSWKLVMLLALASAGRASELGMLNCSHMRKQGSIINFDLPKLTKTCKQGSRLKRSTFHSFTGDKNLCVVSCIDDYLSRTSSWREINDNIDRSWLILSMVKPHHPITSSSIARWLKETIKESGVSGKFTGHSTRSASTSKAKRMGLSVKDIMDQANWANESTFMRFYYKPVDSIAYQQSVFTR